MTAFTDLVVPAVLLRAGRADRSRLVLVRVAAGPTVAFTRRDLRSPGIARATAVARAAGFTTAVRAPGGRMVAYDEGAVVVDDVTRFAAAQTLGWSAFEQNAQQHLDVLRSLGVADARVGEVPGEYCPGEFSLNVGGRVKVVGSAQRVTGTGALFSTVVQVVVTDRVRDVIVDVSDALGYELDPTTIGGVADAVPGLTAGDVADALASDYRRRAGAAVTDVPVAILRHAEAAAAVVTASGLPFDVDAWARTQA